MVGTTFVKLDGSRKVHCISRYPSPSQGRDEGPTHGRTSGLPSHRFRPPGPEDEVGLRVNVLLGWGNLLLRPFVDVECGKDVNRARTIGHKPQAPDVMWVTATRPESRCPQDPNPV